MDLSEFSGKKICVALSGGVDSVTLLHILRARRIADGFSLCAVHCEHGIRGEDSVADMRFVQSLCADLGVPLYTFVEDCPARAKREKESLETSARNFRRECFSQSFSLLMSTFALPIPPDNLTVILRRLTERSATAHTKSYPV